MHAGKGDCPDFSAAELSSLLAAAGVRIAPISPRRLHTVTHLDVDAAALDHVLAAVRDVLR